MRDALNGLKQKAFGEPYLWLPLFLGILTASIGLGLYAYLGSFSRYGSDDYCLTAFFLQDDLLGRMIQRYYVTSGRYTNILFIGLVDNLFGWNNVAILPPLMLILMALGLYLLLKGLGEVIALGESRWLALFMAVSITYFSISQAPDLYETLYWRAGMTSHFAPLVFFLFLGVFLLKQVRKAGERPASFWILFVCFVSFFLVGGLSEPPTAMVVTILVLAMCGVWWWGEGPARVRARVLLMWALLGSLLALLLMAIAPANSLRLQTAPPGLLELLWGIALHPLEFIVDTVRTLPVPTLLSILMPAVLFYLRFSGRSQGSSQEMYNQLGILMIAVVLLTYILIAANFAPSVYGQSYPVARARFAGRLLMTSALMIDGAILGILASNLRMQFWTLDSRRLASLVLMILLLYPLRGAWRASAEIPIYQQRAAAWDLRDSEIRTLQAQGVQDLVVRYLPDEKLQDLGDRTRFRLNRCASIIYGVNSIVAVPMEEE